MNSFLIVDDEPEVCLLLKNFLVRKSKEVNVCYTLKEALEQTRSQMPDVIILDHNMPDGFGIETIGPLKAIHGRVKIIIISAMGNLKSQALLNGADHFIEKPISFSSLEGFLA